MAIPYHEAIGDRGAGFRLKRVMRVVVAAVLSALLSMPAARAADYSEARFAFQRLEARERVVLPLMLIATGRYNGMAYSEFNKRIFRGILEYQQALGAAPTGILTPTQTTTLYHEGFTFWNALGMRQVDMPRGAGSLFAPLNLVGYPQTTERGLAYEAIDSAVAIDLSTYPPGDTSFQLLYSKLSTPTARREVTYKVMRDDFFVVSGKLGKRNYYTKYFADRGYASGFTLSWNAISFPQGDRVAVLMSNTFFPASAGGAPAVSEAEPDTAPVYAPPVAPEPTAPPLEAEARGGTSYGSGFFVSSDGLLVTNNHVVERCTTITVVGSGPAVVAARDVANDLALLRTRTGSFAVGLRNTPINLGEQVYALGYPYAGTLDNGLNITNGLISSLSGIQNDSRYIQITAAVQPGNSGGPLVDESGNLTGVVTARLDDLNMLKKSGALPQNVNFAIRSDFVLSFLRANSVEPSATVSSTRLPASDIAKAGRSFTAQVVCVDGA